MLYQLAAGLVVVWGELAGAPAPGVADERFDLLAIDTLLHIDNRGIERFFIELNACHFKLVTAPGEPARSQNAFLIPLQGPITINIAACLRPTDDNVMTMLTQGAPETDAFIFIADLLLPGETVAYKIGSLEPLPERLSPLRAYPNPFYTSVKLEYTIPAERTSGVAIALVIYDVAGREVRRLAGGVWFPGHFTATWDGRRQDGKEVSSGLYFAHLVIGERRSTVHIVRTR